DEEEDAHARARRSSCAGGHQGMQAGILVAWKDGAGRQGKRIGKHGRKTTRRPDLCKSPASGLASVPLQTSSTDATAMNDLRDLKALIRSVTPVIEIETMEETRAMRLLEELARELDLPLYRWSAAAGLTQPDFRYGASKPAGQGLNRPDLALQDDWRDT